MNTENTLNLTTLNVERVIGRGRLLSEIPKSKAPYLIVKLGPPGSGKSSDITNKEVSNLGVNILASSALFRNTTRAIRNNYKTRNFNKSFYDKLSTVHTSFIKTRKITHINKSSLKSTGTKTIGAHMNTLFAESIRNSVNIIIELTSKYDKVIMPHYNNLRKHGYKIVVIYPVVQLNTLKTRIMSRGEDYYKQPQSYYRTFNLNTLPSTIQTVQDEIVQHILPGLYKGDIYKFIVINNE
jgi:2-phosphoglycerate kinase